MEPIGGLRSDWQAASICSVIANIATAKAGSQKRFRTQDFLLEFGNEREVPTQEEAPRQKSWQEMKLIAMMWAAADPVGAAKE